MRFLRETRGEVVEVSETEVRHQFELLCREHGPADFEQFKAELLDPRGGLVTIKGDYYAMR